MAGRLWVSLAGEGSLVAVDAEEGRELCRIGGLSSPGRIAVGKERVFVVDAAEGTLLCASRTCERIYCVPAAPGPLSLCLSEDETRVYVGGGESESVAMLDARDGTLLATIRVGGEPRSLDVQGGTLLVACGVELMWLDAASLDVLARQSVGHAVCGAVFIPKGVAAALVRDEMRGGVLRVLGDHGAEDWALPAAPLAMKREEALWIAMDHAVAAVELSPYSLRLFPYEGWPDDIARCARGLFVADGSSDIVWRVLRGGTQAFFEGKRPASLAADAWG